MTELILPLGIDLHVHFRTPGNPEKETLQTGYNAAFQGGIGTVLDMPNTHPPIDNLIEFNKKQNLLQDFPFIHQIAAITNNNIQNEELVNLAKKTSLFKLFMANSTGDIGISLENLDEAFTILSDYHPYVFIHAELPEYILPREFNSNENKVRPEKAEVLAVERIIEIADQFPKINFHLTHVSTFDAAELILDSHKINITWDSLARHLKFDSRLVKQKGNYAKMNPPLRASSTREKLYQLFCEGKIPILTSDHAPHTKKDKKLPVAGSPGVQELYLFLIDEYLNGSISKNIMTDMIYNNPKSVLDRYRLQIRTGSVTIDTDQIFHFSEDHILSKCGWSLWEDYKFKGKIVSIQS